MLLKSTPLSAYSQVHTWAAVEVASATADDLLAGRAIKDAPLALEGRFCR
jgi:hypothetical protein